MKAENQTNKERENKPKRRQKSKYYTLSLNREIEF
jgi:hypothetical protein